MLSLPRSEGGSVQFFASCAVGVGTEEQDPDAVALMRRAGMVSSEHAPDRIIPQRGHLPENSIKSPRSENWAVFHEDESGQNLANGSEHFAP